MPERGAELERLETLFEDLWSIPRSITGPGFRESLDRLAEEMPLDTESVSSGTDVFDWTVPPEWRINEARLIGPDGTTYADFDETNLAVVNYSTPVDERLSLDELDPHLHTHPELPEAVPYVTSYYERNWGFCLPHSVYETLPEGEYRAYIDAEFVDGELTYGHTVLPGESDLEVLLSTYLCHPSLANNELSGPLAMTSLYRSLEELDGRRFSYRFVVVPETIGSLTYLAENGEALRERLVGGLVLTCLGGPANGLSYKTTRREHALVDRVVRNLTESGDLELDIRQFSPRDGSDERQYCSPGFNLPVGQVARTVYGDYDEYHTSLDTKEFMGIESVLDSARDIERILRAFERGGYYENLEPYGEPMLSKRDLYTSINSPETWSDSTDSIQDDQGTFLDRVVTVLNYSDGEHAIVDVANRLGISVEDLGPVVERLETADLLRPIGKTPQYGHRFSDR